MLIPGIVSLVTKAEARRPPISLLYTGDKSGPPIPCERENLLQTATPHRKKTGDQREFRPPRRSRPSTPCPCKIDPNLSAKNQAGIRFRLSKVIQEESCHAEDLHALRWAGLPRWQRQPQPCRPRAPKSFMCPSNTTNCRMDCEWCSRRTTPRPPSA